MFKCIRCIRCGSWFESKEDHAGNVYMQFDALDADPGPNLRKPMDQKFPPTKDFRCRRPQAPSGAPESNESNASHESSEYKVGPKARTCRCIRCMKVSDPGPNLMHLTTLKSPPKART